MTLGRTSFCLVQPCSQGCTPLPLVSGSIVCFAPKLLPRSCNTLHEQEFLGKMAVLRSPVPRFDSARRLQGMIVHNGRAPRTVCHRLRPGELEKAGIPWFISP